MKQKKEQERKIENGPKWLRRTESQIRELLYPNLRAIRNNRYHTLKCGHIFSSQEVRKDCQERHATGEEITRILDNVNEFFQCPYCDRII